VALASEIAAGVSRENLGSTFYILGDDIVIADEEVHRRYRGYLGVLGCPVSESKCLVSTVASEFAGKLITRDHVYHGYKYREISDISFLDVMRNLGPQALSVLSAPQRAYAELVWEVPEPYGLGFNPSGRPYAERYAEYLHLVEALEQAEPDTNTLRPQEIVAKMVYGFKSRVWRYFPVSRWGRILDQGDSEQPGQLNRERAFGFARRTDRLVSPAIVAGDPRANPLEGWTTRILRGIKPLLERSRSRSMALSQVR